MSCLRRMLPILPAVAGLLLAAAANDPQTFAHRLMESGHPEEAERVIRASLHQNTNASALTTLGEIQFCRANFEGAAESFRAAIDQNPRLARAYWGLGRIELSQFRRTSARALISKAYGLDPRDPDIILSFADFMPDSASRTTLLRNAITLTQHSDVRRAEESLGRLEMELRLSGTRLARLRSPYRDYTVHLAVFQPADQHVAGLLAPVRINGGKVLQLVLDTGARGISISAHAARNLGLEALSESRIGGLGSVPLDASVTLAKTVSVGDFVLENCVVEVTPEALTRGADGVIGMTLFEEFEIRLDARSRMLQLKPFPDRSPEQRDSAGNPWIAYDRAKPTNEDTASRAYGFGHFLLLKAAVNNREGLFLVDSGSSLTSLAQEFAPPPLLGFEPPFLHGVAGDVQNAYRISPITLRIGKRQFVENEPVALNLADFSRRQGVKVAGILGFPALSQAPVTINYRDGLVNLNAAEK